MFISIDNNGAILDTHNEEGVDLIQLTEDQSKEIAHSVYGHSVYNYIDGVLSEDATRKADVDLSKKRNTVALSRMDFMLALDDALLLSTVEDFVALPDTSSRIKIMWANATVFKRNNPEVLQVSALLNLSDSQIDGIFGI